MGIPPQRQQQVEMRAASEHKACGYDFLIRMLSSPAPPPVLRSVPERASERQPSFDNSAHLHDVNGEAAKSVER